MSFELVRLDSSLEQMFNEYVYRDAPHHFFFIVDWKVNKEETEIWLALRQNKIHGMMLIFRKHILQLRGTKPAARALLAKTQLREIEFNVEMNHREIIQDKFRLVRQHELLIMTLRKGEERLASSDNVVRLTSERAEEIADLMRNANPEFWGDMTNERILASMNRNLWLGILVDDELVSVGNTFLTLPIGNIHTVATHESHRNKGYATSIVSALATEILKENDLALIHVLKDNMPARRVYEKVGFRTYKSYLYGVGTLISDDAVP